MRANAARAALHMLLAAVLAGGVLAACGRQTGGASLPPIASKPVGPGTPVPGAPQKLVAPTSGFNQSVVTANGDVQAIRTTDGNELRRFTIAAQPAPQPPVLSAVVSFASSVSYAQALRAVTDLGLQPTQPCMNRAAPWQPLDLKTQLQYGFLVIATPLSAPGWLARLQRTPGVQRVQTKPGYSCPLMRSAMPGPGQFPYLPVGQAGTTARITFSPQITYDQALDLVYTLGFRLADPCYERLPHGAPVSRILMGQETTFDQAHALLVATTNLNSAGWQRQARASPGVVRVEVSPSVPCGD